MRVYAYASMRARGYQHLCTHIDIVANTVVSYVPVGVHVHVHEHEHERECENMSMSMSMCLRMYWSACVRACVLMCIDVSPRAAAAPAGTRVCGPNNHHDNAHARMHLLEACAIEAYPKRYHVRCTMHDA
jgi:hypothetical protein